MPVWAIVLICFATTIGGIVGGFYLGVRVLTMSFVDGSFFKALTVPQPQGRRKWFR